MPIRFVLLLAGRDLGRVAVTVGVDKDQKILIADGRLRKLEQPKRKNIKHLLFINCDSSWLDSLRHRGALTNEDLAKACKAVEDALDEKNTNTQELHKE